MNPTQQLRNLSFFLLVLAFTAMTVGFSLGTRLVHLPPSLLGILALAGAVLGVLVVVLTAKLQESRIRKVFFWLAGVSAAGVPLCVVLHNLMYGLFIRWFGQDFWGRQGDEPVFFILAIVVCPLGFVIGAFGSLVFLARDWQNRSHRVGGAG
jgi:hypothetical protein